MTRFDAVIAGGGPAGAAAGLLLARAGWSVAIVEKAAFPRPKVCGELLSGNILPLLERMGVADRIAAAGGPAVTEISLCLGRRTVSSLLPVPEERPQAYGRALARERLDAILLEAAARAGARVMERTALASLDGRAGHFAFSLRRSSAREAHMLYAPLFIAAHGSWQPGALPTQQRRAPFGSDLLAFKLRFEHSDVPAGRILIVPFDGGYGGVVRTSTRLTTVACCVRRDALARCRRSFAATGAAEAVLKAMLRASPSVCDMLRPARQDGAALAAGPLRPGVHLRTAPGIFAVGNAAGEAHPMVGEGMSMALQAAQLLADRLVQAGDALFRRPERMQEAARDYEAAWRAQFTPRMRAAALFAHAAMRPVSAALAMSMLERWPSLLSAAARLSGKDRLVSPELLTDAARDAGRFGRASP